MTRIAWIVFALFLIGNAFFVLPLKWSSHKLTTSYSTYFKQDPQLIRGAFSDTAIIRLTPNIPAPYGMLYKQSKPESRGQAPGSELLVNVSVMHDLDFTALLFPFYKSARFNGNISFYNVIRASNMPEMDSIALIGHTEINGRLVVKGICTPLYARDLVDQEIASILRKEMDRIEKTINQPPAPDTTQAAVK